MKGAVPLLITRETDYALRILRALQDRQLHPIAELTQSQLLPQAFAYKILKKLARGGLVEILRGASGGYRLTADLDQTTLYDLMEAMEEGSQVSACMDPQYPCPWRAAHGGCSIHCRLAEVQRKLDQELRSHTLRELLSAP